MKPSSLKPIPDYLSFRQQVARKYGNVIMELAMVFIDRAIDEYNAGMINSAIASANSALVMASVIGKPLTSHIHTILAQFYRETRKYQLALAHCNKAIEYLDESAPEFNEDLDYNTTLKKLILHEWKDNENS